MPCVTLAKKREGAILATSACVVPMLCQIPLPMNTAMSTVAHKFMNMMSVRRLYCFKLRSHKMKSWENQLRLAAAVPSPFSMPIVKSTGTILCSGSLSYPSLAVVASLSMEITSMRKSAGLAPAGQGWPIDSRNRRLFWQAPW